MKTPILVEAARPVVYTCTFLDYDDIYTPVVVSPGVDYVLFSDRKPPLVGGWRWRPMPPETAGMSQTLANRYCKFFPHRLFPDAQLSLYVDGNTLMCGDVWPLLRAFTDSGAALGLFRHQMRDNIEEEVAYCLQVGKIAPAEAAKAELQLKAYAKAGLPAEHVLTENGVLLRRHDAPGLDAAMTLWREELERHTRRDQISLPYVVHATGVSVEIFDWDYKRDNPYFQRYPHRRQLRRRIRTYFRIQAMRGPVHRWLYGGLLNIYVVMLKIVGLSRRNEAADSEDLA
jgi:hypothetical protein